MPGFNIISLFIAAFIPLIFGAFWYHEKVMGGILAKTNALASDQKKGHHPMGYVMTVILSALIAMLLTAILSTHTDTERTLTHGMFHGGGAAIFMAIPAFMVIALFENKSATYILIHAGYWFISMILMGGVIGHFG